MKNVLFTLLFFFGGISFAARAQMLKDTFASGSVPYGIAEPAIMSQADTIITWEKYTPHELALRGFVPGTVIYGIQYYKQPNGYLPTNAPATFEIKFRSGSMDSTIPLQWGAFNNNIYYQNTFMIGGFSSWTIFTNGVNFSVPATTGWQAPLLVDVPFVYTGGTLEIATKYLQAFNNVVGDIRNASENPLGGAIYLSYFYYQGGAGLGQRTYNRPTAIIYHSGTPFPCSGIPNAGVVSGISEVCAGKDFNLYLNNPSAGPGITYQWQQSLVSPVTWSNIIGASGTVFTTNITTTTQYRCIVTCNNSGQSATSTSFTVTPHHLHIDSVTANFNLNSVSIIPHYNDTIFQIWQANYYFPLNLVSSGSNPLLFNVDGSYNINIIAQNSCNADTFVKTIFVGCPGSPTLYDSIISSHLSVCPGVGATLTILDTLPSNYSNTWVYYNATNSGNISGLGNTITVFPNIPTTYYNVAKCNWSSYL